jgi:hypothetical protein
MSEYEIVEVLQSCQPIFNNLYRKRNHRLTEEEINYLLKFKVIWDNHSLDYHAPLEKAGLSDFEFAFLGGYLYTFDLL